MLFYIDHFMEIWLLPPGNVLLLSLISFILWRIWPVMGKVFLTAAIFSLGILSMPLIAETLMQGLQSQYAPLSIGELTADKSHQSAIVVLEAGLNYATPEYDAPTVSESTLSRIRYAAFLHRKTQIPILVSGNDPSRLEYNQADYMAQGLQDYFGVPTRWKEAGGYNTAQEGILSTEMLKKSGINKIYLVTHALHMPRAMYAFRNKGMTVIPAPTGFRGFETSLGKISKFLPTMDALNTSAVALREYIGIVWYQLYYRF
ncbi:MAG: YdcF family protein [Gammaproteobacteria bacterium]|nr:YdcF family protein [Gammaproteobacteria bacterium]